MKKAIKINAMIKRKGESYVAICLKLDIVIKGNIVKEAGYNLLEAIGKFFEVVSHSEIQHRKYNNYHSWMAT